MVYKKTRIRFDNYNKTWYNTIMQNTTPLNGDEMDTTRNAEIVWNDTGIELWYFHETDNFELWTQSLNGWKFQGEYNKSADGVDAAKSL